MQKLEFPKNIEPNETPEEFIKNRLNNIKEGRGYNLALYNPALPERQKDNDRKEIAKLCGELEGVLPEIEDLIRKIFGSVQNITEQTKIAAVYLLVGRAFNTLRAALSLLKTGYNIEAMELSRSGKEALDLTWVFWDDANKNHLTKWFNGKIIDHSIARDFQHKKLNKELAEHFDNEEKPVKDLLRNVHKTMSTYTHSAYVGLLDNVDIFSFDFDYKQYGGYHYSKDNFHVVEDLLIKIIIQLKNSALLLKNDEAYEQVDKLSDRFRSDLTKEQMEHILSKYKK